MTTQKSILNNLFTSKRSMAKTIVIKSSPEIIADFKTSFEKIEDEKSHIYQNISQRINAGIGDAFKKKTVSLRLIKNNKPVTEPSTLDEINYDSIVLESNIQWSPKDIAGELESVEYLIGDSLWEKIQKWAKFSSILDNIFNTSLFEQHKKNLSVIKSDGKSDSEKIKEKEEFLNETEKKIKEFREQQCVESYISNLVSQIMIDKINADEKDRLDKEFEEINNPPKVETPPTVK